MTRRLRVQHVIVQPVLVWDDGDELEAGPQVQPQALPLSKVAQMMADLPGEVRAIQQQVEEESEGKPAATP